MISRRGGFTVIELMITVTIIAILIAIATPSLRDLIRNARMTSLANDLMTDLSLARGEAVKRGVRVSICASSTGTSCTATGWNQGWIVFTDGGPDVGGVYGVVNPGLVQEPVTGTPLLDVILKVAPKINGADETPPTLITSTNNLTATGNYVNFRPSGVTTPGGTTTPTINFFLCDSRRTDLAGVSASEARNKGRHITVTGTGRAQTNRCTCSSATLCTP